MHAVLTPGDDFKKPLCGSVGCIGGYMAIELNNKQVFNWFRWARTGRPSFARTRSPHAIMNDAIAVSPNLFALFYEYPGSADWGICGHRGITRRRAASAITRALEGAEDPWRVRAKR